MWVFVGIEIIIIINESIFVLEARESFVCCPNFWHPHIRARSTVISKWQIAKGTKLNTETVIKVNLVLCDVGESPWQPEKRSREGLKSKPHIS